ncbi:aminotransferase class III [Paenibacillus sp. 598K]|uniref:aminotransferase class III-fold pyridoxal phosphate-dependent enzyme n=1 Tax=Paenibacillus sp. 598K TaxID=1117987 RepID=UPI000FF9831A|nr:aminotransferase class III-fold pyridoxal phosphate-dependent enzyme [Paenibacillus sp. 598K]GBF75594.1 aminotransferase class III [Paenibacillus sp. 598K]
MYLTDNHLNIRTRASKVIPSGTSTRGRTFIDGVPTHMMAAKGCILKATDGVDYLDMRGALGTTLLGYGYLEKLSTRLRNVFFDGPLHSLTCAEEVELAELLLDKLYPNLDQVRFFKTGADGCSAAIKLARAATCKTGIISCGYHGWHDQWSTGNVSFKKGAIPSMGVPSILSSYIIEVEYGDVVALKKAASDMPDLAAIITVPLDWDYSPDHAFIKECRKISTQLEAALIFDEVFCGIRLDIKGGFGFFGVEPDLVILSKSIANGYPISALIGKNFYLECSKKLLMSSTYATDRIAIVAALETLRLLLDEEKDILNVIRQRGLKFKNRVNQKLNQANMNQFEMVGQPLALRLSPIYINQNLSKKFAQEMAKERVLSNGLFLLNYCHTEAHLNQLEDILLKIASKFAGQYI